VAPPLRPGAGYRLAAVSALVALGLCAAVAIITNHHAAVSLDEVCRTFISVYHWFALKWLKVCCAHSLRAHADTGVPSGSRRAWL
jgi:hypothetical protein